MAQACSASAIAKMHILPLTHRLNGHTQATQLLKLPAVQATQLFKLIDLLTWPLATP